jgi:hypothetical protein
MIGGETTKLSIIVHMMDGTNRVAECKGGKVARTECLQCSGTFDESNQLCSGFGYEVAIKSVDVVTGAAKIGKENYIIGPRTRT